MITSNNRVCYRKIAHPCECVLHSIPNANSVDFFPVLISPAIRHWICIVKQKTTWWYTKVFVRVPWAERTSFLAGLSMLIPLKNSNLFIYRLILLKERFSENANKNIGRKEEKRIKAKQTQNKNICTSALTHTQIDTTRDQITFISMSWIRFQHFFSSSLVLVETFSLLRHDSTRFSLFVVVARFLAHFGIVQSIACA